MAKRPIECGIVSIENGEWEYFREQVIPLGAPEKASAKMNSRISWLVAYMLVKVGVGAIVIMNAIENHPDLFLASAQILGGALIISSLKNDKDNLETYISAKSTVRRSLGK